MLTQEQRDALTDRRYDRLFEPTYNDINMTWFEYFMEYVIKSMPELARAARRSGIGSRAHLLMMDMLLLFTNVRHEDETFDEELKYLQQKYPEFVLMLTVKGLPGLSTMRPFDPAKMEPSVMPTMPTITKENDDRKD